MVAVAVQSVALPATTIKWLNPAPLWETARTTTPYIAEFESDQFLPDFLAMMSGTMDLNLPPPSDKDISGALKLYQPLHQRYYLVTGSLVCRQFGMPDRTVVRKNGERTSFVLRRTINGREYGWVNDGPNKGWQPLVDEKNRRVALHKDEERLPLHQVKACMPTQTNMPCEQRMVYYGYIPVSSREKYLAPVNIQQAVTDGTGDPRLDEIASRVIAAWHQLYVDAEGNAPPAHKPSGDLLRQTQLYLILDLGDCLKRFLPDVFAALGTDGSGLKDATARKALFNELNSIYMSMPTPTDPQHEITLANAVYNFRDVLALAQGQGDLPGDTYPIDQAYKKDSSDPSKHLPITASPYLDLPPRQSNGTLYELFRLALKEESVVPVQLLDDMEAFIKNDPPDGDSYFLRLVYEHTPCTPVVSEPSKLFTFARVFDPDAPARRIRIELPSINLKDMRKFKRGVGMQMSPELSKLLNRVHTGLLKGDPLLPDYTDVYGYTMICIFSIPIITILALIVMFIFLILFNIIFWWLPFIMICIRIPKRR
jgi:hypothetical protein